MALAGAPGRGRGLVPEDKEAVFDAGDTTALSLQVTTRVVSGLGLQREDAARTVSLAD